MMSAESIQTRLHEITHAFNALMSVRSQMSSLRTTTSRMIAGADHSAQRTLAILGGSAQGADKHLLSDLQQTAQNGRVFLSRLDGVDEQIAARKRQLQDERERLKRELQEIQQAEAEARRRR